MRVLFLDQYNALGGAQQCLLDLLPGVLEVGWEPHVAVTAGGPMEEKLAALGVRRHALTLGDFSSGRKSAAEMVRFASNAFRLARSIREIARLARPDLVYVNGPRMLPPVALALGRGIPVLFHCHHHLSQRMAALAAAWSIRRTGARVAGCCRYALEPLRGRIPAQRQTVIYNGVAPAQRTPRVGFPDGPLRIGVVGRIAPEKGQAEFLEAAQTISRVLPAFRFVICGDVLFRDRRAEDYLRRVRTLAKGLDVEFLGWREDAASVLASLDLVVVPSIREPATTRVILEAYAAGRPVVAFASGGIPEVVADGETGFLVNRTTPQALAETILALALHSPDRLSQVARRGYEAWRERFSIVRYRSEMLAVMADTAASAQPARVPATAKSMKTPAGVRGG